MRLILAPAAVAAVLFACQARLIAEHVNMVKLHIDSFTVVGIETRTSNAREQTSEALIPRMWKRLFDGNLLNRIPNRADSRIVVVYSDYENGKDGLYTYLVGAKVTSITHLPAGMVSRTVAAGSYGMFTARGDVSPQIIVGLWKHIWSLEKPGQLERAYKTDFEIYDRAPEASPEARVDVYVGLLRK